MCQLCVSETNADVADELKGILGVNRKRGNGVANRVRRVIDNFLLFAFVNISFSFLFFLLHTKKKFFQAKKYKNVGFRSAREMKR